MFFIENLRKKDGADVVNKVVKYSLLIFNGFE